MLMCTKTKFFDQTYAIYINKHQSTYNLLSSKANMLEGQDAWGIQPKQGYLKADLPKVWCGLQQYYNLEIQFNVYI